MGWFGNFVFTRTWCSSALCRSIISLFHVSIISLKLKECHSYHSLISTLGRILRLWRILNSRFALEHRYHVPRIQMSRILMKWGLTRIVRAVIRKELLKIVRVVVVISQIFKTINARNNTNNQTGTLRCQSGYTPSGTPTCSAGSGASSQWNAGSLSCNANSCSSSSPSSVRGCRAFILRFHVFVYHSNPTPTLARTQVSNVANAECSTSSGSTCSPYVSGSRSNTYDCASGYDPSGTATCSLGSWSGGSCVDGSCKSNPTFSQFASLNCTLNVNSGTTCNFTCATGYTATGT